MSDKSGEPRSGGEGLGTERIRNMGGGNRMRGPVMLSGLLGAILAMALIAFVSVGASHAKPDDGPRGGGKKAKNVILLIGDGMDEQQITAARNYELGADGRFALDTLRFTGDKTTYSVREDNSDAPD